ncbi:hypothetical protein GQX73_g10299 [Xylaria multiplex]|uniref:Uncharacterized protein n=1 Tax=Xylaria multiplex TaxID=323545 RepID=A0A7C8MIN4_9PEZI|nr:hypothetical protein GQX73_g10299 [Xylaria multiplex]
MANVIPDEARNAVAYLGEVKIIFYDKDFSDSARPVAGEVYNGGIRLSIAGIMDGIALVPASVDVGPGTNIGEVTFCGFVKHENIGQVKSALDSFPIESYALKFKVHYVSNRFRYYQNSEELTGVHAKAYCWVDAKDAN